ncbi:hypothetical protein CQ11_01365 [Trueperella pyogenes]|uniref:hypothetical protein n=1 Tax=Trueperella pyogenes TaxID=1661 RepID=UPI00043AC021|nr:hypothetical protein [Trueperella pyogenes]AHU90387.1 hypothetical protein CQ11_01365 [Trueperella pyogenes]AWA42774.1 hypothetical protein DBV13_01360 [Trueperella pyogenes]
MIVIDEARAASLISSLHSGKTELSQERRAALTALLTTAADLVGKYTGPAWDTMPTTVQNHVLTTVARELETREKSPGGVFAAFGEHDGTIRLARDPLTMAYPLMQPWIPGGFA